MNHEELNTPLQQQNAEEGQAQDVRGKPPMKHDRPATFKIHQRDLPSEVDTLFKFNSKKNIILGKVIPVSMVPISTANTMLVMASKLNFTFFSGESDDADCYFPLPEYMAAVGTISLALVIMGVESRHIVSWVMQYDQKPKVSHPSILRTLDLVNKGLCLLQALFLFSGGVLLIPQLSKIETEKPESGEEKSEFYCDHQLVMFAIVYVGMGWFFITLSILTFLYMKYVKFRSSLLQGDEVSKGHDAHGHLPYTQEEGEEFPLYRGHHEPSLEDVLTSLHKDRITEMSAVDEAIRRLTSEWSKPGVVHAPKYDGGEGGGGGGGKLQVEAASKLSSGIKISADKTVARIMSLGDSKRGTGVWQVYAPSRQRSLRKLEQAALRKLPRRLQERIKKWHELCQYDMYIQRKYGKGNASAKTKVD